MKNNTKILIISTILLFLILSCTYLEMMKKLKSGAPVFGKDTSIVPVDLRGHNIYVKVKINEDQKEYNFILDTGALTIINDQTAKELNLEKGSKIPGGEDAYLLKKKIVISLGDMKVKDFIVPVFDLPDASGSDPKIDGFIGSDFLRFFRLTIDYKQKKIILAHSTDSLEATKDDYKMKIKKPLPVRFPLIECMIDGNIKAEGMIDTGSPFAVVLPLSLIEKQDFSKGRLLIKSKGIMEKWPFTSSNENYLARVKSLKMGTLEIKNIPVIYAELPEKISYPLLGKNFLSQFLITIDYPQNEILLVPSEDTEFKTNLFSTGLGLAKEQDKIIVRGFWEGSPADKSDIELNDEILEVNSKSTTELSIREINNIFADDTIKDIELLIKRNDSEKIVFLTKEMLFSEIID